MSSILADLIQGYSEEFQRHRHRPFLRATMAGCALVSMAEGLVTLRHRVRVDQILETLDTLRLFDPHEGIDLFDAFVAEIRHYPDAGKARALAAVDAEVAEEPEKARLLVRLCAAVSEQEGEIQSAEWREIQALCARYGVTPHFDELGPSPRA